MQKKYSKKIKIKLPLVATSPKSEDDIYNALITAMSFTAGKYILIVF